MENFILIGVFVMLGIVLRRIEAFPRDTAQVLNMFALYVSLPALILLKVPQIVFSRDDVVAAVIPWGMLLFSVGLVLAGGASLALAAFHHRRAAAGRSPGQHFLHGGTDDPGFLRRGRPCLISSSTTNSAP